MSEPVAELETAPPSTPVSRSTRGLIARYREWLPLADTDPVVTLGEGSTPLVLAERLSERLGCETWVKVEGEG